MARVRGQAEEPDFQEKDRARREHAEKLQPEVVPDALKQRLPRNADASRPA